MVTVMSAFALRRKLLGQPVAVSPDHEVNGDVVEEPRLDRKQPKTAEISRPPPQASTSSPGEGSSPEPPSLANNSKSSKSVFTAVMRISGADFIQFSIDRERGEAASS